MLYCQSAEDNDKTYLSEIDRQKIGRSSSIKTGGGAQIVYRDRCVSRNHGYDGSPECLGNRHLMKFNV